MQMGQNVVSLQVIIANKWLFKKKALSTIVFVVKMLLGSTSFNAKFVVNNLHAKHKHCSPV